MDQIGSASYVGQRRVHPPHLKPNLNRTVVEVGDGYQILEYDEPPEGPNAKFYAIVKLKNGTVRLLAPTLELMREVVRLEREESPAGRSK